MNPEGDSEKIKLSPPVGGHDHILGPTAAPVTIVEFGDYECPPCMKAHLMVKEIQEKLAGQLRIVFRHFYWSNIHPNARLAAEVAEAAAAQGKFWEMHEHLYEHQDALGEEELRTCAVELGLDMEKFDMEMAEGVYRAKVREHLRSGVRSKVKLTPTYFINGIRYEGPLEFEPIFEAVKRHLSGVEQP